MTIAVATFGACSESPKPQDDPNYKLALEEIRKEPKVKEAIMTVVNVLYVTFEDDKTRSLSDDSVKNT